MVIKAAFWVHGNSVVPQSDNPSVNKIRYGWGTHFKASNQYVWFHIPFTTPVILEDIRPLLSKIFVFYSTQGDVKITSVHIYDGATAVKKIDGLALQGAHYQQIDSSNSWTINPSIKMLYGLGLTVGVEFGKFTSVVPEIVFYAAGVDFVKP